MLTRYRVKQRAIDELYAKRIAAILLLQYLPLEIVNFIVPIEMKAPKIRVFRSKIQYFRVVE